MNSLELIKTIMEERVPFNRLLGLRIDSIETEPVSLRFAHREELVGNYVKGILHGGVIAAALDVAGSIAVFRSIFVEDETSLEEKVSRAGRVATVDLRIDYLRPAAGAEFRAEAALIRGGGRIYFARMDLWNDERELMATGTGVYTGGN